ncbi:hypothetical protein [Phaffia rhodozyma]|uniref:Uncharacterized protein n=1 Tax=Phaffia rhodozyma TaxID=264483 RepID=A0A0F7SFN5_PHARH|nr:hypothetical protein [Phaffia rhodozyma]
MNDPDQTHSPSATASSTDDMPFLSRPALAATLSSSSGVSTSSTGSSPMRSGGILLHHPSPSLSSNPVDPTHPHSSSSTLPPPSSSSSSSSSTSWAQTRPPPRKPAVSFAPLPPPPRERRNSITIGVAARGHMLATQQGGGGSRPKKGQQSVVYIQMSDEDWEAYRARYASQEDGSVSVPDIGTFAVQSSKKLFSKLRSLSTHSQTSSSSTPSNTSSGRRSLFSSTKASAGSSSDQDPSRSTASSSSRPSSSASSAVGAPLDPGSSRLPGQALPPSGEPTQSYSQTPRRGRSPPPPPRPRSPCPSALPQTELSSSYSVPSISTQSDRSDCLSDLNDGFDEYSDEDALDDEDEEDEGEGDEVDRDEEKREEDEGDGERRFSLGEINEALYSIARSQQQQQNQRHQYRWESGTFSDAESDANARLDERGSRRNSAFLAQQHWWLDDQKYAPNGMIVGSAGTADDIRSGEITPRRRTSFGDNSRVGAVLDKELSTEGRTPSRAFVLGFDKLDADRAPAN